MKSESQSSSAHKADSSPEKSGGGSKWINILDVAAKLIAAGAVVAVSVIANQFQSSMSASNLLSQREQADSTLRAGMFRDLIGPIVGSTKTSEDISADRERLLVELLALNFHDHFELKPVMLHVDDRLAHEEIKEMDPTQRENARESLRSAARRVQQRQLASLTQVESDSPPEQQACVYRLDMEERSQQNITKEIPLPQPCSVLTRDFDDLILINSPSGLYTLTFTISSPKSWEEQSFLVSIQIANNKAMGNKSKTKTKTVTAGEDFLLTWFDLPFADNTLLADGTRFSLVIDKVNPKDKKATLKLVWFPLDYFSERERPVNHRQLREKLGLTLPVRP